MKALTFSGVGSGRAAANAASSLLATASGFAQSSDAAAMYEPGIVFFSTFFADDGALSARLHEYAPPPATSRASAITISVLLFMSLV